MNSQQTNLAMTIATLGWLLLVVAVGLFFLKGKPYYYNLGLTDQREMDIALVDQFLFGGDLSGARFAGQIQEINGNELVIKLDNIAPNPLIAEDQLTQIFLINEETKLLEQRFYDTDEYNAILEEAQQNGTFQGNNAPLPYTEKNIQLDQFIIGDFISLTPAANQQRTQEKIIVQEIYKPVNVVNVQNTSVLANPNGQALLEGTNIPPYDPGPPQEFDLTPITE